MRSTLRVIRLAAILLPAALLLHELAYLVAGGGLVGAHHYLELVVPISGALAASLALAALLLPALTDRDGEPQQHAPFTLALALLGIFTAQELAEAAFLGGGMRGLAASASVAWLAPPLALLLGTLASALISWLERTGTAIACRRRRGRHADADAAAPPLPDSPSLGTPACTGLSFGFSRRPPPATLAFLA
jgi:hypothetical protein